MSSTFGRDLAVKLVRYYLPHPTPEDVDYGELDETCSLLLRHGTTYNRHEEAMASDSRFADEKLLADMQRRQRLLETRMGQLLTQLPAPDDGYRWQLRFDGLYASLECAAVNNEHDVRSIPLSNY